MAFHVGNFIGGRSVDAVHAQQGATFSTLNPATGEVIAYVQQAGAEEVDQAVQAAQQGLRVWSGYTGVERGRILQRAAALVRENSAELVDLEVADTGKPILEAQDIDSFTGVNALEYYAGLAASFACTGAYTDVGDAFVYTRREPVGVCTGLGAWNYPLQIACWKSAPALACGNSMIFKPSELTPLTALRLAEIYHKAGLPDGVFNVVQGPASTGQHLVRHPGISKISLTGEVSTGRAVMADAASSLKHVTMELGGKSPLIIFGDSDMDRAVSVALLANFYTQGEICSNGTRVFVEATCCDAFMDALLTRVARMHVGDPTDPQTHVGALISQEHMDKVLHHVALGQRQGGRLRCGGYRVTERGLDRGYFVAPAVFDQCTDGMTLVQEEIFGPVMSVLTFETEEEVLQRANATPYGLAAGVVTGQLQRAHRMAAQLQAGVCWINHYNVTPIQMPFGGMKQSGLGRENGLAVLDHYTQLKSVYVASGDVLAPY